MKYELHMTGREVDSVFDLIADEANMFGACLSGNEILGCVKEALDAADSASGIKLPGGSMTIALNENNALDFKLDVAPAEAASFIEFFRGIIGEFKPYASMILGLIGMFKNSSDHLEAIAKKFTARYERPSTYGIVTIDLYKEIGMAAVAIIENNGYYTFKKYDTVIGTRYDDILNERIRRAIKENKITWVADENGNPIEDCYKEAAMLLGEEEVKLRDKYGVNYLFTREVDDMVVAIHGFRAPGDNIIEDVEHVPVVIGKGYVGYLNRYESVEVGKNDVTDVKVVEGPLKKNEWENYVAKVKKTHGINDDKKRKEEEAMKGNG